MKFIAQQCTKAFKSTVKYNESVTIPETIFISPTFEPGQHEEVDQLLELKAEKLAAREKAICELRETLARF